MREHDADPGTMDFERLWRELRGDERAAAPADVPHVAVNMVMALDGATTLGGRVGALTGRADQALLHRLRREADAVLVGAGTVRAEGYGALLDAGDRERRVSVRRGEEPLLCVVSGRGALPADSPALGPASSPLVLLTGPDAPAPAAERPMTVLRAPERPFALRPLLRRLRAELGVERVVCEGGPTLNAALLAEGLVAELFVSLSPLVARQGTSPKLVRGAGEPVAVRLAGHGSAGDFVFLRYRVEPA